MRASEGRSECLGAGAAADFVQRLLSQETQARIESHLDQCAECRVQVSELAKLLLCEVAATEALAPASALETEPHRLARGTLVGRYVVLGLHGAGGMGVVYAAYDPELD